jgi:uncharacterized protein YxeA
MKKTVSIILAVMVTVFLAAPVLFADETQGQKDNEHFYSIMATLENARKELRQISPDFRGKEKREEVYNKIKDAMDELGSIMPEKKK